MENDQAIDISEGRVVGIQAAGTFCDCNPQRRYVIFDYLSEDEPLLYARSLEPISAVANASFDLCQVRLHVSQYELVATPYEGPKGLAVALLLLARLDAPGLVELAYTVSFALQLLREHPSEGVARAALFCLSRSDDVEDGDTRRVAKALEELLNPETRIESCVDRDARTQLAISFVRDADMLFSVALGRNYGVLAYRFAEEAIRRLAEIAPERVDAGLDIKLDMSERTREIFINASRNSEALSDLNAALSDGRPGLVSKVRGRLKQLQWK